METSRNQSPGAHARGPAGPIQRPAFPTSTTVGLGEGLLFGLAAGALLAIPVAVRVSGSFGQLFLVWLGAGGLYGMWLGPLTGLLRVARPLPRVSPALGIGLGMAWGPLTLVGSYLHANTHHRPLGAATYAVVAVGIGLFCLAIGLRVMVSLKSSRRRRPVLGWSLLGFGLLLSLGAGLGPFSQLVRVSGNYPLLGSVLIDGLLGLCLVLVGGLARFPHRLEVAARSAGPLAFATCLLALGLALRSPSTGEALRKVSALWAWLA